MGNGIPLACSKLGGVPGIFIFTFCLLESSRVVSCLGRLLYEIGVCIEVYHSFGGDCIRECGVVYDGILMRSLLVPFAALGILFTQSTLYDDSYVEY